MTFYTKLKPPIKGVLISFTKLFPYREDGLAISPTNISFKILFLKNIYRIRHRLVVVIYK